MRSQVAVDGLRKELLGEGAAPLASRLHDELPLFRVIGPVCLALALLAPLTLADRRLARLWTIGTCQMRWGILAVTGIKFRYQFSGLIFAPFFEVERVAERRCRGDAGGDRSRWARTRSG